MCCIRVDFSGWIAQGGFLTGLIAIGNILTTTLLQNWNPTKKWSPDKVLGSVTISLRISVLVLILFNLVWTNSAFAVEPVKLASRTSGEIRSLQAGGQVGDAVNSEVKVGWKIRRLIRDRILGLAIVFTGLLLLLGLSFIYLRLDHATRGFHSGRLQLLAVFLGLIIVGICCFFLNQIVLLSP